MSSADILPGLGRNGLVNSVRKLSGSTVTGYRPVSDTAEFIAGMVATLVDDGGVAKVAVANNASTNAIGIFFCHKTNSFYRPVVKESQTFATGIITLDHAHLLASSVRVTNLAGVPYTVTTNYTVNTVNGIITIVTGIAATETVLVSYRYKDPNLSGIDQTLGSGNVAVLEEIAEIATSVFDTSVVYALGAPLYVNAHGVITNVPGAVIIGFVTGVPSNDDPELIYKLKIAVV